MPDPVPCSRENRLRFPSGRSRYTILDRPAFFLPEIFFLFFD